MACNDMKVIYEEWSYPPEFDCKIIYPDKSTSTYLAEAKVLALESLCQFFQTLLENKRIDCGSGMNEYFLDMTLMIAKLYYQTDNKVLK